MGYLIIQAAYFYILWRKREREERERNKKRKYLIDYFAICYANLISFSIIRENEAISQDKITQCTMHERKYSKKL